MKRDEGEEDMEDAANEPQASLEARIEIAAADHFARAQRVGLHNYYLWMRDAFMLPRYKDPKTVGRSIDNFLVDRYKFYHRNMELVEKDKELPYRDVFEYMISLLHRQPMITAPMKEDWRDK